jgi:hypothetical protein
VFWTVLLIPPAAYALLRAAAGQEARAAPVRAAPASWRARAGLAPQSTGAMT